MTHFTPAEAIRLMDEGVDAPVMHPPGWDPNSTALALQASRRDYPGRVAIMGAHDIIFSSNV